MRRWYAGQDHETTVANGLVIGEMRWATASTTFVRMNLVSESELDCVMPNSVAVLVIRPLYIHFYDKKKANVHFYSIMYSFLIIGGLSKCIAAGAI